MQVLGLHRKHTYRGVDDLGKKDLSKSDRQEVDGNEKPKGIRVQDPFDPWILHPTAVQPAPPVPGTAVGSTGAGSRRRSIPELDLSQWRGGSSEVIENVKDEEARGFRIPRKERNHVAGNPLNTFTQDFNTNFLQTSNSRNRRSELLSISQSNSSRYRS